MKPRGKKSIYLKICPSYWIRGGRAITRAEELRQTLKVESAAYDDNPIGPASQPAERTEG